MALRWGIVSAGKISHDFLIGLSTLPSNNHVVVAIAARDISRAESYAKKFNIPNSYDSYEKLANDPQIDVVYIGVTNPQHYAVIMLMLQNNKHVLCEKPLCMNAKEVKLSIDFAQKKKCFLMEGIWSRFFPSYKCLKQQICEGVLGEVKSVDVCFGFNLLDVDRLQDKKLGGGTVLDLGVYAIQFCQLVFQEKPKSIIATGELNSDNVDIDMQATLHYSNNRVANIRTSSKETLTNTAVIIGTKGQISVPQFWCPTTLCDVDGKERHFPLPETSHVTTHVNSVGFCYEAEAVRNCIKTGKTQSHDMSHQESIIIAEIEDEIRQQIGVVYDADKKN